MKPRLILLGEPVEIRHRLAKKLSNFFGITIFTIEDILNKKSHKEKDIENEIRFKLSLINACNEGFILCGIPIKEKDLECLRDIDLCIFFNVDEEKAIKNNINRRWCPTCFKIYHLEKRPPLHEDKCDRCDSKIEKMLADEPKTIRKRIFEWYKMLNPITSKYKIDKKLLEIKSEKDIEIMASKILSILTKETNPIENLDDYNPTFKI